VFPSRRCPPKAAAGSAEAEVERIDGEMTRWRADRREEREEGRGRGCSLLRKYRERGDPG